MIYNYISKQEMHNPMIFLASNQHQSKKICLQILYYMHIVPCLVLIFIKCTSCGAALYGVICSLSPWSKNGGFVYLYDHIVHKQVLLRSFVCICIKKLSTKSKFIGYLYNFVRDLPH